MKIFAIRDETDLSGKDLAYLLYYENAKQFYIELPENADPWQTPMVLSSFARKGETSINSYWSRLWVQQRIVPPDRQNIGMILKNAGLAYYDEYRLLVLGEGRCSQDELHIKKIGKEIFDGRILHVVRDEVELPNGHHSVREMIDHVGAVCVIPVTEDGLVYVERQFRYPLGRVITEVPAGKLDSDEEDILEAAKRELREETGLTADHWRDLGLFFPAGAYCNEVITMFLATGLHQEKQELDEDEFLDVTKVPLKDLVEEVMAGRIADAKTQTVVLKAARILGV